MKRRARHAAAAALALTLGTSGGPQAAPPPASVTEKEFVAALIRLLPFEHDPSFDPDRELELALALLRQVAKFRIRPLRVRESIRGTVAGAPAGEREAAEAGSGGATVSYSLVVAAPGPFTMVGSRSGGPQYWTVSGEPTFFVEGGEGEVRIEGRARSGGVKRLLVSMPEKGRFGPVELSASSGRPLIPLGEFGREKALNYRDLLATLARILGKLGRLPKKPGVAAIAVPPEATGGRFLAPLRFLFRLKESGVYLFRLRSGGQVGGLTLDGVPVSRRWFGLPAPEKEEDGRAVVLSVGAGDHVMEVPLGSDVRPELIVEELDEEGGAYVTLLADLGFEAGEPDAPVAPDAMRAALVRLAEILYPKELLPGKIEVLEDPRHREREWFDRNVDLAAGGTRAPVSPVVPAGE